jgi:hypothetical protein
MTFVQKNWKPIAIALLSAALAYALHTGKLTPDQATAVGAILGAVGLNLPAVDYSKPSPPVQS